MKDRIHEGVRVDQSSRFPAGALPCFAAPGRRPGDFIEPEAVPFDDLGKVRADVIKIEVRFRRFLRATFAGVRLGTAPSSTASPASQ